MKRHVRFAAVMILSTMKFLNFGIIITATMMTLICDSFLEIRQSDLCFATHEDILVLIFKCDFEDTFSNYRTVSFDIAEIIASVAIF